MNHDVIGREGVFCALYDAHYGAVRAYAWRRNRAFADDVVAETFLVAWRRLGDIPVEAPLPWLLGVSRNVLLNVQRGERRRREREESEAARWSPDETAVAWESSDEPRTQVWAVLRQLPADDREVLLLVAWEELDRAAIAKVLGCSRANVALRLYRARRKFQALLEESGESRDSQGISTLKKDSSLSPQGAQHD
jgi:RNA polymerase sigma-70 factor, ECF subfamily